jgi:hypothetical protein
MASEHYIPQPHSPLITSTDNPVFIFLVGRYTEFISCCLKLLEDNQIRLAKIIFSDEFQKYFPKDKISLEAEDYSDVFTGEFSEIFTDIFILLASLWIDVQEDLLPPHFKEPKKEIVTAERFQADLEKTMNKLEPILKKIKSS